MKKCFILLILSVALLSCKRQSAFEQKLIGNKWVMFYGKSLEEEIDKWPNRYFVFNSDGTVKSFWLNSGEENMIDDNGNQVLKPFSWKYDLSTEELTIKDFKHKILSIEGDTIHMLRDTSHVMLYNINTTYVKLKKGPGRCLGG